MIGFGRLVIQLSESVRTSSVSVSKLTRIGLLHALWNFQSLPPCSSTAEPS